MTKFAPVAPIHILKELNDRKVLGRYHLLLAHDILAHEDEYAEIFRNQTHLHVILDNSLIELGHAVSIDVIREAADIVSANVIVLPDTQHDAKATVDDCTEAYDKWTTSLNKMGLEDWSFMYVPQGETLQEFAWAAHELHSDHRFPRIGWWGVPRNLVSIPEIASRRKAVTLCNINNSNRKIHMLGFSDDLIDDFTVAVRSGCVNGIDSAVPLRAASLQVEMSLAIELPPRGDWWDNVKFDPMMIENIDRTYTLLNPENY